VRGARATTTLLIVLQKRCFSPSGESGALIVPPTRHLPFRSAGRQDAGGVAPGPSAGGKCQAQVEFVWQNRLLQRGYVEYDFDGCHGLGAKIRPSWQIAKGDLAREVKVLRLDARPADDVATHDAGNRKTNGTEGGATTSYVYDGQGTLVKKSVGGHHGLHLAQACSTTSRRPTGEGPGFGRPGTRHAAD
jgi:hypothetical protein